MKDDLWILFAFGALWLIGRAFTELRKLNEESEKRAKERDAGTRALLEARIEKLEFTVFPSQSDLIAVWLDKLGKSEETSKASSVTDSNLE